MRLLALLAGAALALGAGCLSRSPEVRHFTLGASPDPAPAASGDGLAVYVTAPRLPRYLERPQMVRRLDGGEIDIDERHRWAGGLEANVLRALGDALARRLGSDRVVVHPERPRRPVDRRVAIDFRELSARSGRLELRARWVWEEEGGRQGEAGDGPEPPAARTGHVSLDREVDGSSPEALVRAHDAALRALADELVRQLEAPRSGG